MSSDRCEDCGRAGHLGRCEPRAFNSQARRAGVEHAVIVTVLALFAIAFFGMAMMQLEPPQPWVAAEEAAKRVAIKNPYSDSEMIVYDPKPLIVHIDRRKAPRQLMICITGGDGQKQCDLAEAWTIGSPIVK